MSADRTAPTRSVVEELLRRIGQGDPDRIAQLYAERGDWRLSRPEDEHGRADTRWIRHRSSRADAATHVHEPIAHHVPEEADTRVEHVLVDGEDAVVLGEIRQTAEPTGRSRTARFALHLTVRDGLVVRHHVYEDSLAVARALAPDVPGITRVP